MKTNEATKNKELFKKMNFEEKLEHIWYYYKWYIIIGCLILVGIIISISSCMTTPKSDLTIVFGSKDYLLDETISALEKDMEKYVTDENGDGKKVVEIKQVPLKPERTQSEKLSSLRSRMLGEINLGQTFLFMFDKEIYEEFYKVHDAFAPIKEIIPESTIEGNALEVKSLKLFKDIKFEENSILKDVYPDNKFAELTDNLCIAVRLYHGSNVEGKKYAQDTYNKSVEVFKKIYSDKK